MPLDNPRSGPGSVAEYMVSGVPWVTGTSIAAATIPVIRFRGVSRFFLVKNETTPSTVHVGFTENGLKSEFRNYFTLDGGESIGPLELRCTALFLSCSTGGTPTVEIVAGLTSIHGSDFPVLTGSDGYVGIG